MKSEALKATFHINRQGKNTINLMKFLLNDFHKLHLNEATDVWLIATSKNMIILSIHSINKKNPLQFSKENVSYSAMAAVNKSISS